MVQEEKKYSILDELAKSSGYDIALMTTFNFEINFFERAILNRLYANNVRKVSLFVDSKELTKALQEVDTSHIGRKYMVNPVEMPGSFHPKVILLLGEAKAKLFVGSANIKTSGYAINNEIFNFIEYTPDHSEYLDVINAAINLFLEINGNSYQLDNDIILETKELLYYHRAEENGEIYLLHNVSQSILSQLQDKIVGDIESISIAVPYYDNELAALSVLKTFFQGADIHLYIQNEKSTFPVAFNEKCKIASHIDSYDGFKDNSSGSSNNFYHGKVFLFKTLEKAYILYGSANCTQAALVKSFADGGNIECDYLEIGKLQDYDYFFDNMKLQSGKKLVSNIMTFEKQESVNYFFKYGEEKEGLKLHIGYSSIEKNLKVFLRKQELEHMIANQEVIVFIPDEYRATLADIFEIILQYGDKNETLRCWTYSVAALESNRVKQSDKKLLDDFDIDSNGDKFIEDRCNLLKAELTCLPELQEHKKKLAYYNQIKRDQESDDAESEDFIVDIHISDEYRVAYKQYNAVSRIRNIFVRRFLQAQPGILIPSVSVGENHKAVAGDKNCEIASKPRKATLAEKSFERFVKNKVKGMMNDAYVEIIEPEHYIGIILVVLDIFNKYNNVDKVEDIFETDYVMRTRTDFFIKLLNKEIKGDDVDQISYAILQHCYGIFLENYQLITNEADSDIRRDYDTVNKHLLMEMEKKFAIRSIYEKNLSVIYSAGNRILVGAGMYAICSYIENLFGYKNYEMLEKSIKSVYDEAVIEVIGKVMNITAYSDDMLSHSKPNISVLREIKNYSRYVSPIDSVKIIIDTKAPIPENKIVIVKIMHTIDFTYHKWSSSSIRKDGSVWDTKPVYLGF
ncbi:MAG: hypothetical protein K0Q87_489 [Neobacillus sp.]|jgi:hypothetical protein|nr:hypothetical protein [Neobacillus sp.]